MSRRLLSILATGLLATGCMAESCATGLYMIVARGTTEAPGAGRIGVVSGNVSLQIPGSVVAPVDYPATFADYEDSEQAGATAFRTMIVDYAKSCPTGKIALLGYSQGAQALMDNLCGTSETGWNITADLGDDYDNNIIAAVTFGDPSHVVGASWDLGTSTHDGLFPRLNTSGCEPFSSEIRGWCDTGDIYCDAGNKTGVHGSYFANYTDDAVNFIVGKYNATLLQTNTTATTTMTSATSSATSSSTSTSPATTSSSATNSAAGMQSRPSILSAALALVLAVGYGILP